MEESIAVQKIKRELSPYILPRECIDEGSSETIGTGSYGTITKIKYCGTPCAAKELHSVLIPELASFLDPDSEQSPVSRFCNEIKLLSKIHHPNFVCFVGIFFKGGSQSPSRHCPLLVMELMQSSLSECLEVKPQEQFPVATKIFILRDVARAVTYIHSQSPPIVHRDLTANNVLLTSNMVAKVADLGVAKFVNNPSRFSSTQCPGTVVYMPPEALNTHPRYGTEIDMYSYGVLGFHTFSAKWPLHQGASKKDGSILSDLERCHVDMVGEGSCLKETLEKCLHLNPTLRPTANKVLEQVEAVILDCRMEENSVVGMTNYISKLQAEKVELIAAKQRLHCSNEDFKETVATLQDDKRSIELEVARLHAVIEHQQSEIQSQQNGSRAEQYASTQQQLIEAEHKAKLRCLTIAKEKEDLSDTVERLEAQVST